MAGKYHRDFRHYRIYQDGNVLAPGHKGIRAYAEGYSAFRAGGAKANPHVPSADDESDFQSWEYGWQDGERGAPATHVGKPNAGFAPVPGGDLAIIEPLDGATVPPVFDIRGSGAAGFTVVNLWSGDRDPAADEPNARTVSLSDGSFVFGRDRPAVPGEVTWTVTNLGETSPPVTVTVAEA
jgi:hypothetical protein